MQIFLMHFILLSYEKTKKQLHWLKISFMKLDEALAQSTAVHM